MHLHQAWPLNPAPTGPTLSPGQQLDMDPNVGTTHLPSSWWSHRLSSEGCWRFASLLTMVVVGGGKSEERWIQRGDHIGRPPRCGTSPRHMDILQAPGHPTHTWTTLLHTHPDTWTLSLTYACTWTHPHTCACPEYPDTHEITLRKKKTRFSPIVHDPSLGPNDFHKIPKWPSWIFF